MSYINEIITQPHTLIAGATGSGKSVMLDNVVCALLEHYDEDDLQLVLIDPKKVGLAKYQNVSPCAIYADEITDIVSALDDVITLMDKRYNYVRDHNGSVYSTAYCDTYSGSHVYVIIDELADLMVTSKKDILPRLQRIAQLGRAALIHLIVATQAPSRKVIPAELTLNFTCRIALRCDSAIESRQIIKEPGAERLPMYGNALMRTPASKSVIAVDVSMMNQGEIVSILNQHYGKADELQPEQPKIESQPVQNKCGHTVTLPDYNRPRTDSILMCIWNTVKTIVSLVFRAIFAIVSAIFNAIPDLFRFIQSWFKLGLKIAFWTLLLAIFFI